MEHSRTALRDEDLRAQVAWVDSLARRVAFDETAAADLAQDAWVRVLRRPPRDGSEAAGMRGWLARVVGSAAIDAARSARRRERREAAVARPEATESTLDVVERAEARRAVIEAVLALAEPYRTTVLLRHLDELDSAAIAAQMGVSPEVVRKRLSRGLARLRVRLGAAQGRGARLASWLIGLLADGPARRSSTARRVSATSSAARTTASTAGPATHTTLATGALPMVKAVSSAGLAKLALGAVALASLTGLGWWLAGGTPDPDSRPMVPAPVVVAPVAEPGLPDLTAPGASVERLTPPTAPQPSLAVPAPSDDAHALPASGSGSDVLTLLTVDAEGHPVAGVAVHVAGRFGEMLSTNTDGEVSVEARAETSLQLLLVHERYLTERLELQRPDAAQAAGAEAGGWRHAVTLQPGSRAWLTVLDVRGEPVPGAKLRLYQMVDNGVEGTLVMTAEEAQKHRLSVGFSGTDIRDTASGPDGVAALDGLRPGPYQVIVRAPGFVAEEQLPVEIGPGGNDLGVIILADAARVEGVVLGEAGPVRDATVRVLAPGEYLVVTTDEAGRFVIDTLSADPGALDLIVQHPRHDTLCLYEYTLGREPLVLQLLSRRVAQLILVDPVSGTRVDAEVTVTFDYGGRRLPVPRNGPENVRVRAGELAITDLETCLQGVMLGVEGYPRTWVGREDLLAAVVEPLPVLLEGEALVLLVVTDVRTGALLPEVGLSFAYQRIDEQGRSLDSYAFFPPGSRPLFDATAGGCPLDAQHLRVGPHADDTDVLSVTVLVDGYEASKPVTLVEHGELVRRGELRIPLEPSGR